MKNEKKETVNNVVNWPDRNQVIEKSRFKIEGFDEVETPDLDLSDDFEDLYSAEICDWWEPFSEQYPVQIADVHKVSNEDQSQSGNIKKSKTNLSVKLMDMLNDDVIAKLQGIAMA